MKKHKTLVRKTYRNDVERQKKAFQSYKTMPIMPDYNTKQPSEINQTPWVYFSKFVTCCLPDFILKAINNKYKDKWIRQAFREKIALCFIILIMSLVVCFMTLGLNLLLCGNGDQTVFQKHIVSNPQDCNDRLNAFNDSTQDQNVFDWNRLPSKTVFVINGVVINADGYLTTFKNPITNDELDSALRKSVELAATGSKDATKLFQRTNNLKRLSRCVRAKFKIGIIDKETPTCFLYNLILISGLIIVVSIIMIKFSMAFIYYYFVGVHLAKKPSLKKVLNIPQSQMREVAPLAGLKQDHLALSKLPGKLNVNHCQPHIANIVDFYTVLLVTCYSEGEESLRKTLDSLASTSYRDDRKLLFVVADGIVTGQGNPKSTPDLLLDMIEIDETHKEFGKHARQGQGPKPYFYDAIGSGSKKANRAKVYAGWYTHKTHRVPTVVVVKCGTEEEKSAAKPGNRGKRDSQLVLMNFFSRCIMDDRMSELDFDLFRKVQWLTGKTPDHFEVCLMVDADSFVSEDSLSKLLNCLHNDSDIMGLCGETRIANKKDSFVTGIQVYEYFISHHLGKSFESIFGGVTCLPGCFCMWKLKARPRSEQYLQNFHQSADVWVPLLTSQDIIHDYNQNEVNTLHEKNLLLLGEDRFLTTLMLRKFPKRKIMFVPNVLCHTVVPDTFKVLLSQRRRWINSTVHNLLELVLIKNLCGIFCFSMQFVIFLELLGTAILPASTVLLFVLLAQLFTSNLSSPSLQTLIPLIILSFSLFLPAVLVLATTKKIIYVLWMFVYLLAIPIWQLILPLYAFWNFDDFSWGETRKLNGEKSGDDHSKNDGKNSAEITMKKWAEWESRRRMIIREVEKRRFQIAKLNEMKQMESANRSQPGTIIESPFKIQTGKIIFNMKQKQISRSNSPHLDHSRSNSPSNSQSSPKPPIRSLPSSPQMYLENIVQNKYLPSPKPPPRKH